MSQVEGENFVNQDLKTKRLVMTGLMAALVFAASWMRFTVPASLGTTSFHLGNIACALAGIVLGPLGGLAAGIGSLIFDLFNPLYVAESWITFLTKGAYGLAAGLVVWTRKGDAISYRRCAVAATTGAVTYALVYFFKTVAWNGMLMGRLQLGPALLVLPDKVPATIFNAALAILCAPPLAVALQKAWPPLVTWSKRKMK